MQVQQIMSHDVVIASPEDTVQSAAKKMADINAGVLPVGEHDTLVGMVTDRDIVIRAVAKGAAPGKCKVRDVMSSDLKYCYEDESVDDLARNMSTLQVKRLPVLNRQKRLVGIVSLGDLATAPEAKDKAQAALSGISRPS
jgi:CBS domain-containing protein